MFPLQTIGNPTVPSGPLNRSVRNRSTSEAEVAHLVLQGGQRRVDVLHLPCAYKARRPARRAASLRRVSGDGRLRLRAGNAALLWHWTATRADPKPTSLRRGAGSRSQACRHRPGPAVVVSGLTIPKGKRGRLKWKS